MVSCGLDISKGYSNVGIIDKNRNLLQEIFKVDDTKEGHQVLEEKINWALSLKDEKPIRIGVESTGGYESNFLNFLLKLQCKYPIEVYRLNPLSVKKYSEIELHRAKTDNTSAIDIANYLQDMRTKKALEIISPEIQSLKRLIKLVELDNIRETGLRNRLQLIIHQTFPELIRYCRDGIPAWILKLLKKYQCPTEISSASISELCLIPYLNEPKARTIITLSTNSIGGSIDYGTKLAIKKYSKKILEIMEDITEVKKEIENLYKKISSNKLTSIFGIGEYSAAVITAFTINIDRFETFKKYLSFFGLDPRISDSGDESKRRRITKKGSSIVRKILYTSVLTCLSNKNHPVNRQYRRLIARGVHHYSAVTACMRKLLSIIYGILKSNKDFDINYEDKRKSDEQSSKVLLTKKLRIQKNESLNTDPPISKKEYKRRKKIAESYKSTMDLNAGSSTIINQDTKNKMDSKQKNKEKIT